MPQDALEVRPSAKPNHVKALDGTELAIPEGWALLEPGDPALSRRIKKDGPTWTVKEAKGRKMFSRGIWAPAERIEALRAELEVERQDPAYQRKLDAGRERREKEQEAYAKEFRRAVFEYLDFAPEHRDSAEALATAIATHAVPVGSGTVARTQRIPIERRAEAATIAWMRHQTTAYDHMKIPREKGRRREVRRMLAQHSKHLLGCYRQGGEIPETCPLRQSLNGLQA